MDKQLLNEINTAYYQLEQKQAEIVHALSHRIFEPESGWYNGHYHKGDNGNGVQLWHILLRSLPGINLKHTA